MRWWPRALDDRRYRLAPLQPGERRRLPLLAVPREGEDLARFHGTNERLAIANYGEMIDFYHQLLAQHQRCSGAMTTTSFPSICFKDLTMTSAVIVSTARTPLAKSWKGAFNMTHGATLGGHAVQHAVQRAGIDPPRWTT